MARRVKDQGIIAEDVNGFPVHIGTFIHFIFRTNNPMGELDDDIQGRIVTSHGRICFRFKNERGRFSEYRLTALNYDPGTDWEYCREFSYHPNKFKERVVYFP